MATAYGVINVYRPFGNWEENTDEILTMVLGTNGCSISDFNNSLVEN